MKKFNQFKGFIIFILTIVALFSLSACASKENESKSNDLVRVVTTNSIIADMVENIGKDKVSVHSIVPIGTDPHEYEPLPEDIAKTTDADIVFYNGLNLETGGGWFNKLMQTTKKKTEKDYFAVSKGVEPIYLETGKDEGQQDPHAWLDVGNGIIYAKNIEKILCQKDPKNKSYYQKNAIEYIEKLTELNEKGKKIFLDIPQERRLLVTSEGAFKYFSYSYNIQSAYIWEINTEDQGTPNQMKAVIDKVQKHPVTVLFVETSVDKRSMETVSRETNKPIYATLFTDSLGKKGSTGDSYYKMMTYNIEKIHEGLSQ